jgi:hypothetical protein
MYNINILQYDKVKTQKYQSKSNKTNFRNRFKMDTLHDCSLYWLGTNTSIKSGRVKLVFMYDLFEGEIR